MRLAVRDHNDELMPCVELETNTSVVLKAQADALGVDVGRWIETVLRVALADLEGTQPARSPAPEPEVVEIDIDPVTLRRLCVWTDGESPESTLEFVTCHVARASELEAVRMMAGSASMPSIVRHLWAVSEAEGALDIDLYRSSMFAEDEAKRRLVEAAGS